MLRGLSCSEARVILVPRQGIRLTSPALQGRLLTTGPGKSQCVLRFYAQMAFHSVDGVHSVIPFIHQWTLGLRLPLGGGDQCCRAHMCVRGDVGAPVDKPFMREV